MCHLLYRGTVRTEPEQNLPRKLGAAFDAGVKPGVRLCYSRFKTLFTR